MSEPRGLRADAPLRVVALGGGTGLAALLRALKPEAVRPNAPWRLTGIVTVSDNGGSSGRLRDELGSIPPGDLRNCLAALTLQESVLSDLLNYRFGGEGPLAGHALGNLMLAALADLSGSWVRAIRQLSGVLVTAGRLYPSTLANVELWAEDMDGRRHVGETAVNEAMPPIARVGLEPHEPEPLPEAILAVLQADLILLAPGSLFSSTLANLLIPELRKSVQQSQAPRVYVANLMTEPGESHGYSLEDHAAVIQALGGFRLDAILANNAPLPKDVKHRYDLEGGEILLASDSCACGVPVFAKPLLDPESLYARHHPIWLNRALREVVESL